MEKYSLRHIIRQGLNGLFYIFRKELKATIKDQGVLIFFLLVPLAYPLIYAFIYTNEVVREVPTAVVDANNSSQSRKYIRMVDGSPDVHIQSYCADMEEARLLLKDQKVYGIIYIPESFSQDLAEGKQAHVSIYCDMSGMLYYKAILLANTETSLKMNKEIQVYSDTLNTLMERYADEYLVPESEGKDVSAVGMEIAREEMKWKDKLLQYQLDFIKKHADSPVAMDQAMYYLSGMEFLPDVKEIDQMQALFEKHWAGTAELEHFTTAASAARPLAVGQKYKDIDVLDRNGKTVKLSSMIPENEYVMLEFWASWCGPCRGEIPHLRKIHDKYKDFAIVSISLDEKESEWQKAMKEENMSWTQGRIEGGIYGAGAKEYNIQAIPMCLILDKEGRFYKTNMRGAYLDVFLDDLYKAN